MAALAAPEQSRLLPTTAPSSTLAIFDLDRTLIPGSSLVHLGRALARRGLLSPWTLPTHVARNLVFQRCGASESKAERVRDSMLRAFSGTAQAPLLSAVTEVAADVARDVYSGAGWLLEQHLDRGDFCVVLSASPHELVSAVSGLLGAHRGVGTVAEVVDGCYTVDCPGPSVRAGASSIGWPKRSDRCSSPRPRPTPTLAQTSRCCVPAAAPWP